MEVEVIMWLTGGAAAAAAAGGMVAKVMIRHSERTEQEQDRRLGHLEEARAHWEAQHVALRDEIHRDYVRAEGLGQFRAEVKDELRELRGELKVDMRAIAERNERAEAALHERLNGIGRQLERLVCQLSRHPLPDEPPRG